MSGNVFEGGLTPISGALVSMDGLSSTTNSSGYYEMHGVIAGENRTIAASQQCYASFSANDVTVGEGANTYEIDMIPNSVNGTVFSSAGGNVGAGANITIAGVQGTTAAGGTFSILRVPSGLGQNVTISQSGYLNYIGTANINSGSTSVNFTMSPDTVSGTVKSAVGGNFVAGGCGEDRWGNRHDECIRLLFFKYRSRRHECAGIDYQERLR